MVNADESQGSVLVVVGAVVVVVVVVEEAGGQGRVIKQGKPVVPVSEEQLSRKKHWDEPAGSVEGVAVQSSSW